MCVCVCVRVCVCFRHATRGGGGRPPLSLFENRKKCPDFEKKVLIISVLGLNLPFKM